MLVCWYACVDVCTWCIDECVCWRCVCWCVGMFVLTCVHVCIDECVLEVCVFICWDVCVDVCTCVH